MRSQFWWAGALLILACAAPATPVPATVGPPPTVVFTPNPNEPWRLTATVVATQAAGRPAQETPLSLADRAGTATVLVGGAQTSRQQGDFGQALSQAWQASTLTPNDRDLQVVVGTMQRQATMVIPTQVAAATQAAQELRLTSTRAAVEATQTTQAVRTAEAQPPP
jgi:hypothetical protein